ncbi:hypothetical protein VTI74DRAFT_2016 [Chaetomium olivicolor]
MGKGGKKPTEVTLDKAGKKAMQTYLDNAKPEQISVPEWGISKWQDSHGEGRSSSKFTFHIGFRYMTDTGCYWTCILAKTADGELPVAGTLINWGTVPPDPLVVMETYKNAKFPLPKPDSQPSGSGSGGGAGGAGGSSSGGAWKKTIHQDGQGGYFYYDANWEYHQCDKDGNDVYYTTQAGHQTSNPRNIKAVVGPPGSTYYYSGGKQTRCALKSEQGTNRQWFVDAQGKSWHARYFPPGMEPAEKRNRNTRHPQSSASVATRAAPAQRSAGIASPSNGSNSSPPSQRRLLTDAKSGRQYYVDSAGRTHWA